MQTKTIVLNQTQIQKEEANDHHQISLNIQWHSIKKRSVTISNLLSDSIAPIGIEISHEELTTLIDFTRVTPYEIWYFDNQKQFMGKAFSFQKGSGTFRVETQARFVLLLNIKGDGDALKILRNFDCKAFGFELTKNTILHKTA
jgi:hypothetical protein